MAVVRITAPVHTEPERDQWGRYVIPDAITGEKKSWTRATTMADTISESWAITNWEKRMVALGLSKRPDLLIGIAAVLEPESRDGKRQLNKLVEAAKEHAGGSVRSTIGSALHSFCEGIDKGIDIGTVPAPFDRDIAAYRTALESIQVSRNYIEKIGVVRSLSVAGTMDRVVKLPEQDLPMIGDLKTGSKLEYSWQKIAIQLALYAHFDSIFDPVEGRHHPMIQVDQERALIIHLPAGEGRCTLFLIDIAIGWQMAQICFAVREYQQRDNLARTL